MNYKNLDQLTRNKILKESLITDKVKLIERHGLIANADLKWISKKENSHEQVYFTHTFAIKSDLLGLVFRINKLCFAKLKYFRLNLDKFEPYIYKPEIGFEKTELWNADFLKHIASGLIIDYRFLQRIVKIDDFKKFCLYLESHE